MPSKLNRRPQNQLKEPPRSQRDDTGGPFASRGHCSIHNEGRPARRSAVGTVSCERLPARARRPTPGRSRVAATPLTALGQPGDRSTLSSQATSQRTAVTGDEAVCVLKEKRDRGGADRRRRIQPDDT